MRTIEELRLLAKIEKEEYEIKKEEFYNNPLHWSNNKRRMNGLPVLRGKINKNRIIKFHSFHPSAFFFGILEDVIDDMLKDVFINGEFFNDFVEVKPKDEQKYPPITTFMSYGQPSYKNQSFAIIKEKIDENKII